MNAAKCAAKNAAKCAAMNAAKCAAMCQSAEPSAAMMAEVPSR
jgi:hypothetical protein